MAQLFQQQENFKLKKPSIVLEIDFGKEIVLKKVLLNLKNYKSSDLINKQVAAVINFAPKQIGNLISEVLVLGFPNELNEPILIEPNQTIPNGGRLF